MKWFDIENRLIKIIKHLETKSEISIAELAKRLDVSTKTVQNDIKQINKSLRGSAIIDLNRSIARLFITDFPRYQKIRSKIERQNTNFDSPQMRMAFISDILINEDSPYLIDELAYSMNISHSTMIKDLNSLKSILTNYDLTIVGQSNMGISLKGEELNLRFFILDNNYSIICADDNLTVKMTEFITKQLGPLELDRLVLDNFLRYLNLSLNRCKKGHIILSLPEKYQYLKNSYYYLFLQDSLTKMENIFAVKFSEEEKLFLTIPLISMRVPYDISALKTNVKVSDDVLDITKKIIRAIKENMDITINEQDSNIINEFVYHNYFLLNRLRYGMPMHSKGNVDIRKKYSVAYHMALTARNVIKNQLNLLIPEEEIDYLTAYFQIFLTERNTNLSAYHIALVCTTGRVRTKLIMSQLQKIFDASTSIDIILYNKDLSTDDLTNYDLLISTVKLNLTIKMPIIEIDEVVDETYLKNSIDRLRYGKHLPIPLQHGIKSIIFSLLNEKNIVIIDKSLNYDQCLHKMINNLTNDDFAVEDFARILQAREKKSSMVLDKYVAFPHAKYDSGKTVHISLGLAPDGLNDKYYPDIKIIFLVAIPKFSADDTILVKIYDEIISIASKQQIIKDISKMTNYHDILMYLIKGDIL